MDLDLGQLLNATRDFSGLWNLAANILGVIFTSLIVIEISPIKVNPIKHVWNWISKGFKIWFTDVIDDSLDKQLASMKEEDKKRDEAVAALTDKVDRISDSVATMQERMDANEERAQANHISLIRNNVLTFANNLRAGLDASKESFDNIIDQIDEYNSWHNLSEQRKHTNGKMILSIKFIQDEYSRRFNHVPSNRE